MWCFFSCVTISSAAVDISFIHSWTIKLRWRKFCRSQRRIIEQAFSFSFQTKPNILIVIITSYVVKLLENLYPLFASGQSICRICYIFVWKIPVHFFWWYNVYRSTIWVSRRVLGWWDLLPNKNTLIWISEMWNCYLHYYFIFYYNTSILISVCNLRFIYDIDLIVSSTIELKDMTNKLVEIAGVYGMERNTEKSNVMVNGTSNTSVGVTIDYWSPASNTWK